MKRSDLNIAIIEDDAALAEVLKRTLTNEGYSVTIYTNPMNAIRDVRIKTFHLAIVDCILPKVNGIDLIKKMREESPSYIKSILMSGVMKNDHFIKDSLESSDAEHFLKKPFTIEEVTEAVNKAFADELGPQFTPPYQFLADDFDEDRDFVINFFREEHHVSGFELPYLLCLIRANKLSGTLTVEPKNGETAFIKFYGGQVFQVQSDDTESYFGVLLIEKGFSTPEEIARGLAHKSEFPIGKKLWSLNALSPHAIEIVVSEQLSIRLSKLIKETQTKIVFKSESLPKPQSVIEDKDFVKFLSDWITSKLRVDWLKAFYEPWLANPLSPGPMFENLKSQRLLPILSLVPGILESIQAQETILEVSEKHSDKLFLYHAIHFLLINEFAKIGLNRKSEKNFDALLSRFKRIKEMIDTKSHYEVFDLNPSASKDEIMAAYKNFAINLHPDKISNKAPDELKDIANEIFQKLTEIQQTLCDENTRQKYDFELKHGQAEQIIKTDSLFEKGLDFLRSNNFNAAVEAFQEVYSIGLYDDEFPTFFCWALLKRGAPTGKKKELLEMVEKLINLVPQEKRHNSNYFYVKGLFHKLNGDLARSSTAFKQSFSLNPSFRSAQLEWMSIEKKLKRENNSALFGRVTSVFRKKSS